MPPVKPRTPDPVFLVTAKLDEIKLRADDSKVLHATRKLTLEFKANTVVMLIAPHIAARPRIAMSEVVAQLAVELGRALNPELMRVFTASMEPDPNAKPSE